MKELWRLLTAEEFSRCRKEINEENWLAMRLFCQIGLPLSIAIIFAQGVVIGPSDMTGHNL
jgi:hypothetical protein